MRNSESNNLESGNPRKNIDMGSELYAEWDKRNSEGRGIYPYNNYGEIGSYSRGYEGFRQSAADFYNRNSERGKKSQNINRLTFEDRRKDDFSYNRPGSERNKYDNLKNLRSSRSEFELGS